MATLTIEDSLISSDADMGESHEKIHHDQHTYLMPGEEGIIELGNTNKSDSSRDLALAMAQQAGLKSPSEWEKYNDNLRPSRRKNSYDEYVAAACANVTKAKQRALDSGNLSKQARDRVRKELNSIRQHKGLAVSGGLYYVGSVDDYDGKSETEIQNIRNAKTEVLTAFANSDLYAELHPQSFRKEIHKDELGDVHLQDQRLSLKRSKNGRVSSAKRALLKDILERKYANTGVTLDDRLTVLSLCHDAKFAKKLNIGDFQNRKIGDMRADAYYNQFVNGKTAYSMDQLRAKIEAYNQNARKYNKEHKHDKDFKRKPIKYSKAEKTTRLTELARIEQMNELDRLAGEIYPKYGLSWKREETYTTNGDHLTPKQYQTKRKVEADARDTANRTAKAKKVLQSQRAEWNDNATKIKQQRKEMAELQAKQKQLDEQKAHQEQVEKQQQANQIALDSRRQALDERKKALDAQESKLNDTLNEIKTDFVGWLQKRGHKIIADMMEKAFDRLVKLRDQKKRQRILDEQAQQQADDMAVQFITDSKQADNMAPTLQEERKPEPYRKVIDNAYNNQLPSHQMTKKRTMTISEQIDAEIAKADAERKAKEKDKSTDNNKDKDEGFTL